MKPLLLSLMMATMTMQAQAETFEEMRYTPAATTFSLIADPSATRVDVVLSDADGRNEVAYRMTKTDDGHWCAHVGSDLKGRYYAFRITRGKQTVLTPGLFAKAVDVNGQRGAIIDLSETNPDGWLSDQRPPLRSPVDLVIYELHHRDFSIDESSGLIHKGKYLALTEPLALEHLQRLGVNAVHLLPSFDFASVDEARPDSAQYNWGYDPLNYNVPEGSYSTNAAEPSARIREFKAMVQALHRAGIRVILDVVYNHTFNIEGSNFQKVLPDYFYRKRADGSFSDGSGCGNETASERPLMRRFMVESMKYWVREYHIDGFRVDLMGVHDIETMNTIREELDRIDPTIFVYGEGWSAGACAFPQDKLATKANTRQLNGIAAFCDDMRDAIRGPFSDDAKPAFLAALPENEESIKFGIAGAINHPQVDMSQVNYSTAPWTNSPSQMISYVSCHDDMCLVDRLRASMPDLTGEELIRLDLLAQTAVLTSQGVPFLLSGEEMLRDKKGVHNSFNAPDSVNRLDWHNLERYPQVFDYYSGLIHLRRSHPAFRLGTAEAVCNHLEFLDAPSGVVAFRLHDNAGGDPWHDIIVVLNANREPAEIAVPDRQYTIVAQDGKISEQGLGTFEGKTATAAAQSALIIHD